jgi:hypothetical protein
MSTIDEFDSWLTQNFAAVIITRFIRNVAYQSKHGLFYSYYRTKSRALKYQLNRPRVCAFGREWNKPTYSHSNKPMDYYQALLYQRASVQDKLQFWKCVIELKRTYPRYSNELLMKALIESNGDTQKSIILLENQAFLVNNTVTTQPIIQLNQSMKELFFPFYDNYQEFQTHSQQLEKELNQLQHHQTQVNPFRQKHVVHDHNGTEEEEEHFYDNTRVNTNISMIRSLKSKHNQVNKHTRENMQSQLETQELNYQTEINLLQKKSHLLFHLMNIMEKTYLPSSSALSSNSASTGKGRPRSATGKGKSKKV